MNQPAAPPDKAALREAALSRRAALAPETHASSSAAISQRVIDIARSLSPASIALYLPFGGECDPGAVVEWAVAEGIPIALPVSLDQAHMAFRRFRPGDTLVRDHFGIRAPGDTAPVLVPALIVTPVSAFDRAGHRIGKGRGFYDRTIVELKRKAVGPTLVGVAFSVQEVPDIPSRAA